MTSQEESLYKMLDRVKKSPDGPALLEYLKLLSAENYAMFKRCNPATDEYCKGYAVAIDSLHDAIATSARHLESLEIATKEQPIDGHGIPVNIHT